MKLAQAYERKDRKFKEAEALRAKTNKKLEAAEATLKRYCTTSVHALISVCAPYHYECAHTRYSSLSLV